MTFREQRRGQLFCMYFHAFGFAMICVPVAHTKPWLLFVIWAGWELILRVTRWHRCWRDNIDLDEQVPLDAEGRPLV